jgi:hypothetical protein
VCIVDHERWVLQHKHCRSLRCWVTPSVPY